MLSAPPLARDVADDEERPRRFLLSSRASVIAALVLILATTAGARWWDGAHSGATPLHPRPAAVYGPAGARVSAAFGAAPVARFVDQRTAPNPHLGGMRGLASLYVATLTAKASEAVEVVRYPRTLSRAQRTWYLRHFDAGDRIARWHGLWSASFDRACANLGRSCTGRLAGRDVVAGDAIEQALASGVSEAEARRFLAAFGPDGHR